jgi:anti-anti-sigma factor
VEQVEKTDTDPQTKWSRSGRGLTAEAEVHDDEVRIELHGEVDLYTQPVLRSALAPALELEVPSLVVDLRDVTHLDSGGMAILISAAKKLRHATGS